MGAQPQMYATRSTELRIVEGGKAREWGRAFDWHIMGNVSEDGDGFLDVGHLSDEPVERLLALAIAHAWPPSFSLISCCAASYMACSLSPCGPR